MRTEERELEKLLKLLEDHIDLEHCLEAVLMMQWR